MELGERRVGVVGREHPRTSLKPRKPPSHVDQLVRHR
jgi:hypothetical protein